MLGTAATTEVLSQLPPERTVVALDSFDGEVVTHGWTKGTGQRVEDKLEAVARGDITHEAADVLFFVIIARRPVDERPSLPLSK